MAQTACSKPLPSAAQTTTTLGLAHNHAVAPGLAKHISPCTCTRPAGPPAACGWCPGQPAAAAASHKQKHPPRHRLTRQHPSAAARCRRHPPLAQTPPPAAAAAAACAGLPEQQPGPCPVQAARIRPNPGRSPPLTPQLILPSRLPLVSPDPGTPPPQALLPPPARLQLVQGVRHLKLL